MPRVKADLEAECGRALDIDMDALDPNTVVFRYPCVFGESSILREIRIESGALAAWTPAKTCDIVSYAAEYYPQLFKSPAAHVYTVAPERTFWEKATILHREAMRTPERGLPPGRYSRHYYDLWCLCQSDVKARALDDIPLLDAVVAFKRKFYRCSWAHYELATAAEISLMPPEHALAALEADYRHMQNMIFGPRPPFSEILDTVRVLEAEVHQVRGIRSSR